MTLALENPRFFARVTVQACRIASSRLTPVAVNPFTLSMFVLGNPAAFRIQTA